MNRTHGEKSKSLVSVMNNGVSFLVAGIAQFACAYVLPLVLVISTAQLLPGPDSPLKHLLHYVIFGLTASGLALVVSRLIPGAVRSGRLVWLPGVLILTATICFGNDGPGSVRDYFWGYGESGWVMMLETLPVWGCCCYSAVMALQRLRITSA